MGDFINHDELFLIVKFYFYLSMNSPFNTPDLYIKRLTMHKVQIIWPHSNVFLLGGVCMAYSYLEFMLFIKLLVYEGELLSLGQSHVVKFQQDF